MLKPLVGEPEIDWQEIFAFDNNGNSDVLVSVSYMQGLTTTQENITTLELTVSKNHNSTFHACCINILILIFCIQNTLSAALKIELSWGFSIQANLEASMRSSLVTKESIEESESMKNTFGLTVGAGKLVRIRQAILKFKSTRGELFELRPRHFDVISEQEVDCIGEDTETVSEDEAEDQPEFVIIDGFVNNDLYTFTAVGEGTGTKHAIDFYLYGVDSSKK